jgi:hypothetical protein
MNIFSFLEWAEFVIGITVSSVILYFAFLGYRQTKLRALALWIFSTIVYIILFLARFISSFWYVTSRSELIIFTVACDILWTIGAVGSATAFVMFIRYLLSEHERRGKDAAS